MYPVGILEKDQPLTAEPRFHVKRHEARYLESRGLAVKIAKNLYQMLVTLKAGVKDAVRQLIQLHRSAHRGDLKPPLDHYPAYTYPLPYWMLRSYQ